MTMSTGRRLAALFLVVALFTTTTPTVHAATKMRWGYYDATTSTVLRSGTCSAAANIWAQELGKSGITRLRVQWQLRGPYDPGYLPTYFKTGWYRGGGFPDDARSFYSGFRLNYGIVNFATNKQFSLWAKMVGERPSFWKPDVVIKRSVGDVACSSDLTELSG